MDDKKRETLEGIKSGKVFFIDSWNDITLDDLLSVDENNITYLEYAYKNKVCFSREIKNELFSNFDVLYICVTKNFFDWVDCIKNEDIYFEKRLDGKSLIDYIFENNVKKYYIFYSLFEKRIEIVDYIIKYDKDNIYQLSPEIIKLLLTEKDGNYPIDKYINYPKIRRILFISDIYKELLDYCKAKNNYDLLKEAKEDLLLYEMEDGKKVIEFLFDKGIEPIFIGKIGSADILNILIERDRIDLLYKADVSLLLSMYDNNRTYFDLMFEKQRQGVDVHLEKVSFEYYCHSSEETAKELIKYAQNDFQMFIPSISKRMLLYKGWNGKKSVLEYLVDIDRELTISKILPLCSDRKDPNFVIVLRNLGIEGTAIDIKTEDAKFSDTYIEEYNENYARESVSVCPELIDELRNLFYNDGVSDKSAVDSLITSYTFLTSNGNLNKEMFIQELRHLIDIKKSNLDNFTYTKIADGAYFSPDEGGICLDSNIISTINHETSHALHYYLASDYIPDNYFEVIERVRNSEGIIDRIGEYSKRIVELKEQIRSQISKSKIEEYYNNLYQGDKLLELSLFLGMSKEEQKEKLIDDYNEQVLDVILAGTYSVDEFIKQRIEIEIDEMVDAILRNDYSSLITIGDIIDAIFKGKFRNGALFDSEGKEIKPAYGHGISYYDDISHGFDEMIANYGTIIKSQNGEEILVYLRSIVGDEVVDMIKDVYENNILKSQVYEQGTEMEAREHAR